MILGESKSERNTNLPATGEAWYCARTKPKHEHIAAANLARRLGLEVFCPRLQIARPTRRGVVRVMEPLFPCYIFVRCNLAEKLDDLRHTTGVSTLVNFGGRVAAVADEVVEDLRRHFEGEAPVELADALQPGTAVVVSAGAFEGMRANVLRTMPSRQRVQILLEILGRPTMVEVERGLIAAEEDGMAERLPFLAAA